MKYTMNTVLVLLATATITVGCNAQKDSTTESTNEGSRRGGPPSIEEIMKMDNDGDGLLAKNEIEGPLKNDFEKIDLNKDGFLSREELEKAPKPERGQGPPRR